MVTAHELIALGSEVIALLGVLITGIVNICKVTNGQKCLLRSEMLRIYYCNLFTPRAAQDGAKPKYSVTLLIPKSDKATIQKINGAIEAARAAYLARNNGKKLPANLKTTLHDGDGERPNGGEFGEECKGCYVMTVSSINPPVIVDAQKTPITDPQELYSGCYGRAIIKCFGPSLRHDLPFPPERLSLTRSINVCPKQKETI